jgi:hypothetical protein
LTGKSFFAAFALLVLAACSGPQVREPVDVISTKPPLVFAVGELIIENVSLMPADIGFRQRQWTERLGAATEQFLLDRLETTSGIGWLQVSIDEARLIEDALPVATGVRATLTREPDRVLDALVRIRLSVMGADGLEQSFVEAEVQRRRPILRNTSVMARDAEAERLIGDLMVQLDDELTQAARQHLGAYLLM